MTFDEINALTTTDVFFTLVNRIRVTEINALDENVYWNKQEVSETQPDQEAGYQAYKNLTGEIWYALENSIIEPNQSELDAELVAYQAELTAIEQARLDEIDRLQGLQDRFDALNRDSAKAACVIYILEPNVDAYFRDQIYQNSDTSDAESKMLALEGHVSTYESNDLPDIQKQSAVQDRKQKISEGQEVIALMSYLNDQRAITVEDSQALLGNASVQSAVGALQVGALETAKAAVQAIDLTGLVVTEADRTEIIAKIDSFLA